MTYMFTHPRDIIVDCWIGRCYRGFIMTLFIYLFIFQKNIIVTPLRNIWNKTVNFIVTFEIKLPRLSYLLRQIGISLTKSFIFDIGISHSHQPFTCGNTVLTSPLTVKDLGIIVDPHLKFTNHIFEIVKKVNQRATLIHSSFLSKNPTNLILAYKIYVRPLLKYASPVWNPSQINLINTLEAV